MHEAAFGKAASLASAIRVLREMAGPRFPELFAALSVDTRALIEAPPPPDSWLAVRHIREVLRVAHEVLYPNDLQAIAHIGKEVVLGDLTTLYRMFIRVASPQYVIERAAKVWDIYSKNGGTQRVLDSGDTFVEVAYQDVPQTSPAYWAYLQGTIAAALTATGCKDIVVQILGGGGSESFARMRATWK